MPIYNIPGNVRGADGGTDYPADHVADLFQAATEAYALHGDSPAAAVQTDGPGEGGGWKRGTVNGWCVTTAGREGRAVVQAREWSESHPGLTMTVGVRGGKAFADMLTNPDTHAVLQARVVPS